VIAKGSDFRAFALNAEIVAAGLPPAVARRDNGGLTTIPDRRGA
jgi:hypothetical protein